MSYRMILIQSCILICLLINTGCVSEKVENRAQESRNWAPVLVDSIPQLEAVEVPLDTMMLSEFALQKIGGARRIPLTDEVVIAFESWSPEGLLNPDRSKNIPFEMARQFAAYCTTNGRIILAYNFVNIRYRPCRNLSEGWRSEIIMDTKCTDLGIFESNIACPIDQ